MTTGLLCNNDSPSRGQVFRQGAPKAKSTEPCFCQLLLFHSALLRLRLKSSNSFTTRKRQLLAFLLLGQEETISVEPLIHGPDSVLVSSCLELKREALAIPFSYQDYLYAFLWLSELGHPFCGIGTHLARSSSPLTNYESESLFSLIRCQRLGAQLIPISSLFTSLQPSALEALIGFLCVAVSPTPGPVVCLGIACPPFGLHHQVFPAPFPGLRSSHSSGH